MDELPSHLAQLQARLPDIADGGSSIAALRDSARVARSNFASSADTLMQGRLQAAARLDYAVGKELPP